MNTEGEYQIETSSFYVSHHKVKLINMPAVFSFKDGSVSKPLTPKRNEKVINYCHLANRINQL